MRFEATDLFTLRNVGSKSGKPEWANQRAYRRRRWKGAPEDLAGPGIYGLFFKQRLVYVGIFAGARRDPFRGSVLDRWQKHVTYQSLRAPVINFAPRELQRILAEIQGPVGDEIARCLPDGRSTICASLDPKQYPLVGDDNGSCCTFRKARFAALNWDAIGPGSGDRFLEEITFVYERIPADAETLALLRDADEAQRRSWIKHRWLAPREHGLIETLRPLCNSQVEPGRERSDVGIAEFETALAAAFAKGSLTAFTPGRLTAGSAGQAPPAHDTSESAVPDLTSGIDAAEGLGDQDDVALAERVTTEGEERFRRDLPVAIEELIDDLEEDCPARFVTYFTKTGRGDFRVGLRAADGRMERVLLRLHVTRQTLHCETLASVAACGAFGFDVRPLLDTTMKAVFDVDPAEHGASDLFAVAGAAVQQLKESA